MLPKLGLGQWRCQRVESLGWWSPAATVSHRLGPASPATVPKQSFVFHQGLEKPGIFGSLMLLEGCPFIPHTPRVGPCAHILLQVLWHAGVNLGFLHRCVCGQPLRGLLHSPVPYQFGVQGPRPSE